MAPFTRTDVSKWHDEVPGTRWFRADLHIHTLDDAIGGNISWQAPAGVINPNDPTDTDTRTAYVHCFLKAAVAAGIDVLGLTPHSAHVPGNNGISVVWDIVDAWQTLDDDDGTPFREKIYAVFPGFEPSASDGKGGIHLLVLFDPEIGKDRYVKAFTVATGGQDVWRGGKHQTSTRGAKELLGELKNLKIREGDGWDYLCIAPHAFSDKGVVESLKGDLGKHFTHGNIAALELKDNHLQQDAIDAHHNYLEAHLKKYCQPLIHGSDAYGLVTGGQAGHVSCVNSPQKRGIGYRYTLVKLASARIESLRQAFLSNDSRIRIVYEKNASKQLQYRKDIPISVDASRPWLRSISVEGGTSFFGGKGKKQVLRFSPDFTCVIGSRMTGKSTLLDGIRTYCKIADPQIPDLANDVKERSERFHSGNPTITLDIVSPVAATLPFYERWPARFFTQRELANISKDADNVRKILYHLDPSGNTDLFDKDIAIKGLDDRLNSLTASISGSHAVLAEKEQAFETAKKARQALDAFKEAGAEELSVAQADQGRASGFVASIRDVKDKLSAVYTMMSEIEPPTVESLDLSVPADIKPLHESIAKKLDEVGKDLSKLITLSAGLTQAVDKRADELRSGVQKNLVDQGRMAEELNQFEALSKIAANYELCRIAYETAKSTLNKAEEDFDAAERERLVAVSEHREALGEIIKQVNENIANIRVSLTKAAARTNLDKWIRDLKESGITRWWNENQSVTDPSILYNDLIDMQLFKLGMSETVATRFVEQMTSDRKYQLRSLRSDDKCHIEARVGTGAKDFRPINKLSGGKQISVLLSLLLESSDTSPLVIDQPEDELDKTFLAETLLPILRRLKGKRQIIFATHDANLVVNGDADQVIHLEADADSAKVKTQDAIDNPEIRHAILTVLDGGKDAFDLRKRKYGF
jgi:ABC-type cobalamin/Fe3+-siderophores transport system ATPase subunit